jgi:Lhr-like helicase
MTTEGVRPPMWKELYHVAMLEPDLTKLAPLLADAINVVLDEIEETVTDDKVEELNSALNRLRSRRKEIDSWRHGRIDTPEQPKAA